MGIATLTAKGGTVLRPIAPNRCAEFFLAMQNVMGVHPSWAELGYDSIVACREHLER